MGRLVKTRLMSGIVPKHWVETTYEGKTSYSVTVRGERLSNEDWDYLVRRIKEEFEEQLLEVYSVISNGVYFTVYLKK